MNQEFAKAGLKIDRSIFNQALAFKTVSLF
jgi:hypothetical protein